MNLRVTCVTNGFAYFERVLFLVIELGTFKCKYIGFDLPLFNRCGSIKKLKGQRFFSHRHFNILSYQLHSNVELRDVLLKSN